MNISLSRISAVVHRHLYLQFRELYRIAEAIYWPVFDIALWGFTAVWMQEGSEQLVLIKIVTGMTLWQVFYRNNLEISTNVLEEIWERNMINLFSSPLKFSEWILGLLSLAILRSTLTIVICVPVAYYFFGVNVFQSGLDSAIWLILLALSGWMSGFLSGTLLITYGRQVMSIPWIIAWIWAPLCGALFPVEILPGWLKKIAYLLPMTYVFEDMRLVLDHGRESYSYLYQSAGLTIIYLVISLALFKYAFEKTKVRGLARLS